jgi:hypothetical protein
MSWSNWTPDQYSAQRREQIAEAASLARLLSASGSTDAPETQTRQSAASDVVSQVRHAITDVLARLHPRPLQR